MTTKPTGLKPSRTFTIAIFAMILLTLAMVAAVAVAFGAPGLYGAGDFATLLGEVAMWIGVVGAGGSGAMAARDWGSGGLTSSQGDVVAATRQSFEP